MTLVNRARALVAHNIVYTPPSSESRTVAPLLQGLELRISPGEIVGVTGPSGSGKSTIVRLLSGLLRAKAGVVELGGQPVGDVRKRSGRPVRGLIGVVQQSSRAAMDPRLRLGRSLELASRQAVRRRSGIAPIPLAEIAGELGLTPELLLRRPSEVSEGQLQRAALLRTFAHRPEVILCDEVTAALDPISGAQVMAGLRRFARDSGGGVLLVSHDLPLLDRGADRVLTLRDGSLHPHR